MPEHSYTHLADANQITAAMYKVSTLAEKVQASIQKCKIVNKSKKRELWRKVH